MPNDDFYAQFSGKDDGSVLITHGPRFGQISLKLTPDRMFVLVEGEPEGEALTACFEDALASGQSKTDVPTLVDLTRFHGSVDWNALHAVRAMAAWGKSGAKGEKTSVAYVVRSDAMLDMVIKVLGVIFVNSQHRVFGNHGEALAWLDGT